MDYLTTRPRKIILAKPRVHALLIKTNNSSPFEEEERKKKDAEMQRKKNRVTKQIT